MDEKGQIVKNGKFSNDPQGLEEFMEGIDEALVAMEAGYCWQPLYDRLEETEHDVRLTHPLKVKAIEEAKVKTDKIDSDTLAHLLKADLLSESYVPPRDIRELRDRVRRRAFLVGMRTMLKNRVHVELAKRGIRLGVPRARRRRERIPFILRTVMKRCLRWVFSLRWCAWGNGEVCRSGWAFYGFTCLVHGDLLEMNLGTSQRARDRIVF